MTVNITPTKLNGTIIAPPSKSFVHRSIICSALSNGKCKIYPIIFSEDILATLIGMKKLGAHITEYDDNIIFHGFDLNKSNVVINCHDSGSTLRFLIPIAGALGVSVVFKRGFSLRQRPIVSYLNTLSDFGIKYEICSDLSLKISGELRPGKYLTNGDVSSQFVSGLLFALPLLKGDSTIEMTSELESSKYVDITIDVMKEYGVHIEKCSNGFFIKGNQSYKSKDYVIEGDWSQAAFFMAAGAINGDIKIKNLNRDSLQGDREILSLLSEFGASISWNDNQLEIKKSKLHGIDIDVAQIPDLVPILAVIASYSEGTTKITNAKRLKFKECDRLDATYKQLRNLGVDITKFDDGLIIKGNGVHNGGTVWSHNDHRMAMALSIMAINLSENLQITDADSVKKSYPSFFEDYRLTGGKVSVINMGK